MLNFIYFKISRYNTYKLKNSSIDFLKNVFECVMHSHILKSKYIKTYSEVSLNPEFHLLSSLTQFQSGNQDN